MKTKLQTGFLALVIITSMLAYTLTTTGGDLDPPTGPSPTMHTLDEIFNEVDSLTGLGLTRTEKAKIRALYIGPNPGPFLRLEIAGNQIDGESTITTLERENTIECSGYSYELSTPREESSGQLTGRRQHSTVTIAKPVDKTTPLLYKALCNNEVITKAEFRFYRPNVSGSGSEEHYYTVLLENCYISRITSIGRGMQKVSFVFQDITWTYEIGGATHKDSWAGEL